MPSYAASGAGQQAVAARVAAPAAAAKKLRPPMRIVASWKAGPGVGQTTIRWKKKRTTYKTETTGFRVETSLTQFGPYGNGIPRKGRHWRSFKLGPKARQLVLNDELLRKVGAPVASGNHVYFRVWALNKQGKKKREGTDGKLRAAQVRGMGPTGSGAPVTFASYNVRLAGKDVGTSHDWYKVRLPQVARAIVDYAPGIVAVQEGNPTPYHPYEGDWAKTQLLSLRDKVNEYAATDYALVRSTYYADYKNDPEYNGSQQGMRILYDTARYTLLSNCPDITYEPGVDPAKTPNKYLKFNRSCAIQLPLLSGDAKKLTRWAAYAHLQDKATKQQFWVVSVHLDKRATGTKAEQKRYEVLRRDQVNTALARIAAMNTGNEPVIFAGDLNTYQNTFAPSGHLAHDALVSAGFYDTFAASTVKNRQYDTHNDFEKPKPDKSGVGARLDVIMTKGIQGASSFENVIRGVGPTGPSDHDMIVATFNLP